MQQLNVMGLINHIQSYNARATGVLPQKAGNLHILISSITTQNQGFAIQNK